MKPKSYTFINSYDDSKSMATVPHSKFISINAFKTYNMNPSYRYSKCIYGLLVKKTELDNEHKLFYTVNGVSFNGTSLRNRRIAFVKCESDSNPAIHKMSAKYWSVCSVHSKYPGINVPDDSYFVVADIGFSGARIRCFETEEDAIAEYKAREAKRLKKLNADCEAIRNAPNNGSMFLRTPKYKVNRIHIATDYLKDVHEGDIIYGEIQVLENGKNKLKRSSSYVNYIDLYVNNKLHKTLPMNVFGKLMSINVDLTEIS